MRIISYVLIFAIAPFSSHAGLYSRCNSEHKKDPKCGTTSCCSFVKDPSKGDAAGHSASVCNYLHLSDVACKADQSMALVYTSMAIVCGVACVAGKTGYGSWSIPICSVGSIVAGLSDTILGIAIGSKAKGIKAEADEINAMNYGVVNAGGAVMATRGLVNAGVIGKNTAAGATAATKNAATAAAKKAAEEASKTAAKEASKTATKTAAKNAGSCISMVLNAAMASAKQINKSLIANKSEQNFQSLLSLISEGAPTPAPSLNNNGMNNGNMPMGADSNPPTVADMRENAREAEVAGESARLPEESYAMAGNSGFNQNHSPQPYKDAMKAIDDQFGLNPNKLADLLDTKGVGGAVQQAVGGDDGNLIGDLIRDMEKEYTPAQSNIAFESSMKASGGGGGGKPNNPFGDLFGNRGPKAAEGGLKTIKFSGFDNDIWHAGTTLSIFEIVSKKTQTVTPRVLE